MAAAGAIELGGNLLGAELGEVGVGSDVLAGGEGGGARLVLRQVGQQGPGLRRRRPVVEGQRYALEKVTV
jgi:hypothetical protein